MGRCCDAQAYRTLHVLQNLREDRSPEQGACCSSHCLTRSLDIALDLHLVTLVLRRLASGVSRRKNSDPVTELRFCLRLGAALSLQLACQGEGVRRGGAVATWVMAGCLQHRVSRVSRYLTRMLRAYAIRFGCCSIMSAPSPLSTRTQDNSIVLHTGIPSKAAEEGMTSYANTGHGGVSSSHQVLSWQARV